MSSNIIFKAPGRTTTYMPIDVNMPKEEILNRFARASFSTDNEWPFKSPAAGFYDIKNSNTKLILLNNQQTWSHLRGKTKPKKEPFIKDPNYDWVEKEIEMKKAQESSPPKSKKDKRLIDPVRHFLHTSCSYKVDMENNITNTASSSANTFNNSNNKMISKSLPASRARTAITRSTNNKGEEEETTVNDNNLEKEMFINYLYAIGPRYAGFQNKILNSKLPKEFASSHNLAHPDFNNGQRLFFNNLCNIYSVSKSQKVKQEQYSRLLDEQKSIDNKKKLKYRFYNGYEESFEMYQSWFNKSERPVQHHVNCGYFSKEPTIRSKASTSPNRSPQRAKSCRPDKREYSNKSIEKSKHRHHKHNDENKKKSNEDKLSDLNATESYSSFPSPKEDSDLK